MKNQSKCAFCGRFFTPDVRVGSRQKSCTASPCQIKRKRVQEKQWRVKNTEYFKDRYEDIKAWREAHPGYQKEWRSQKRLKIQTQIRPPAQIQSVRLHLRHFAGLGEIQTQFCRIKQAGNAIWVDGAAMHPAEIQTQIAGSLPAMG